MNKILIIAATMALTISQTIHAQYSFQAASRHELLKNSPNLRPQNLEEVDALSEQLKQEILNSESRYQAQGKIYYVSCEGNDDNDGLSPESPIKTLSAVNSKEFAPGDVVLFRRGDTWRGKVKTRTGVTYSAYGKGHKPRIYGSPWNGVTHGYWTLTEVPDVYVYSETTRHDVGTLVFDEGAQGCAYKVIRQTMPDLKNFHMETKEPFEDYRDLKRDLDLWHDYYETGRIYLCSKQGNPAQRFSSIEFLTHGHCFSVNGCNDVKIDNFCIKYTGSHGIGAGAINNFEVTNCELGWIGGSIQYEGKMTDKGTRPTRFGNAVEIWGACDHYVIDHCWAYQIYDAALTFQYRTDRTIKMRDITFSNNLVEDCVYSIELFLSPIKGKSVENSRIEDALFAGNILRRAGHGWGYQRPNKESCASIKAWGGSEPGRNASKNFRITNNVIDRGYPVLLDINAPNPKHLPVCKHNTYLQTKDVPLGTMLERNAEVISVCQ